jgi:hypothetical protein
MAISGARQLALLADCTVRALVGYYGAEALWTSADEPSDRRFSGKGIAIRNALIVGSFTFLLPLLQRASRRRTPFPWAADAVLLSIPALDMAGNSLDIYNGYGLFDSFAHCYGTAACAGLAAMAMEGRAREPVSVRWLVAIGGTTFFHVLLEVQEYWTDMWFGTHNVEGIEDVEGDVLWGVCGALSGVALFELALRSRRHASLLVEARRLARVLEPVFRWRRSRAAPDGTRR